MSSPVSNNSSTPNYYQKENTGRTGKPIPKEDRAEFEKIVEEVRKLMKERDELLGKNIKN